MPCHDREDATINYNKTTTAQATNNSSGCPDESCPPLCHCTCCGTTFVINTCTQLAINKIEIVKVNSIFIQAIPTSISFSIWQPPKIA